MDNLQFSLEVFPPKDNVEIAEIYNVLQQFVAINPDFISVTYGAGGSDCQQNKTAEISSFIADKLHISSVAHLTCVGATKQNIQQILQTLKNLKVKNILALRGDLPQDAVLGDFKYATDLIEFINQFGGFDVFAACYPEGHSESENFEQDLNVAKMKYDFGVKRFITQLFFDNEDFYRMRDEFVKRGIKAPISAGIMPLTNPKQISHLIALSGCKVPPAISKMIARFGDNPDVFYQAGLNYSINQITDLLTNGVEGIHLYSMNKPKTALTVYNSINTVLQGVKSEH